LQMPPSVLSHPCVLSLHGCGVGAGVGYAVGKPVGARVMRLHVWLFATPDTYADDS
jgi:hypothetical protein